MKKDLAGCDGFLFFVKLYVYFFQGILRLERRLPFTTRQNYVWYQSKDNR